MYTRARKHAGWQFKHNRFPSLWLDAVSCVILSGALRPLTAGSVSERCEPAGRVLENKSVSLSILPPPPSIRFPPNKEALRLVVSKRYKFISK